MGIFCKECDSFHFKEFHSLEEGDRSLKVNLIKKCIIVLVSREALVLNIFILL